MLLAVVVPGSTMDRSLPTWLVVEYPGVIVMPPPAPVAVVPPLMLTLPAFPAPVFGLPAMVNA